MKQTKLPKRGDTFRATVTVRKVNNFWSCDWLDCRIVTPYFDVVVRDIIIRPPKKKKAKRKR